MEQSEKSRPIRRFLLAVLVDDKHARFTFEIEMASGKWSPT